MVFHEAIQIISCLLRDTFGDDTVHVFQFLISSRVWSIHLKNVPVCIIVIQIWNDAFRLVSCCLPKNKIIQYIVNAQLLRCGSYFSLICGIEYDRGIKEKSIDLLNLSFFFAIIFRNTLNGYVENMNHITFAST